MTKEELINLLEHSGRNIDLGDAYNEDLILKKYVSYIPTTQTIFQLEGNDEIRYYDYYLYEMETPNYYGELYIPLPDKPGITFDYSCCDEQSMLNLLDNRIRQYEEILKEVKQKNKEWKMTKDFV